MLNRHVFKALELHYIAELNFLRGIIQHQSMFTFYHYCFIFALLGKLFFVRYSVYFRNYL